MRKNTTALKSVGQRLVREASQPAPAARRYDVIVFGATGFTGLLTAQYYARRQKSRPETFTWAIAGRSLQKMNNLEGIPSSVPRIVANSNDQASLEAMTRQTKVVATTVGPYIKYGAKLVAACIATGTHYCDLTGEFVWVRDMIKKHHQAAQAARCKIVFCCGFDCVPVDLGTYMASTLLPSGPPTRVRALATRVNGAASGGTLASAELIKERLKADAAAGIPDDPYMLAHDIVGEPANGALPHHDLRVDTADLSAGQTSVRWDSDWGTITIPYVMAFIDCRVIRRSICLRGEKTSYSEAMSLGGAARVAGFVLTHLPSFAGVPNYKPGDGPTASVQRDGSFSFDVLAQNTDNGEEVRVRVSGTGDPGYSATAIMLGESALCLALDSDAEEGVDASRKLPDMYGCLTPSTAMGLQLARRLEATGRFRFDRFSLKTQPRL